MRRVVFPLMLVTLLLAACGGPAFDPSTTTPPNSTAIEQTGSAEVDSLLQAWRDSVPGAMQERAIKPETIAQATYRTTSSLTDIQQYYETTFAQNGWMASRRTPGIDAEQGVLISGYETGTTSLIVGAIDATKYGGEGVVVYTASGNK